jgi:hypothetical protein
MESKELEEHEELEKTEIAEVKTVARALAHFLNYHQEYYYELMESEEHFIYKLLPSHKYTIVHYSPKIEGLSEHDAEMLMYEVFAHRKEFGKERTGIALFYSEQTGNFYFFEKVYDELYEIYEVVVYKITKKGMKDWADVDLGFALWNDTAVKL